MKTQFHCYKNIKMAKNVFTTVVFLSIDIIVM